MKHSAKLIFLTIFSLAGVGFFFFIQNTSTNTANSEIPNTQVNTSNSSTDLQEGTKYISYNSSVLTENASKRRILFFYANWCPTCRPADENFIQNEGRIPNDVVLIRVNYNDTDTDQDEEDLAKKYGITYQHTFVQIDSDEQAVTKWNGGELDKLLIL